MVPVGAYSIVLSSPLSLSLYSQHRRAYRPHIFKLPPQFANERRELRPGCLGHYRLKRDSGATRHTQYRETRPAFHADFVDVWPDARYTTGWGDSAN